MTHLIRTCTAAALMAVPAFAQSAPTRGEDVLDSMRTAYLGKWYSTLTFSQTTIQHRPTGVTTAIWYESLRQPADGRTVLRIDFGNPADGNGVLYTADSSWRMRDGKLVRASDSGNDFLPLIEGVYMQPVAQTIRQVASMKVDLKRIRFADWNGRPTVVVGASTPADTTSPQFWVDRERNVVVRFITASLDVTLGGYERIGPAWLATNVKISQAGQLIQEEQYANWRVNVPLAEGLFDVSQWTSAPHWAKPPSH